MKSGAGVGRLSGFANAPIEADNGGMGGGNGDAGGNDSGDNGGDGGDDNGGTTPSVPSGSEVGGGWTMTAVSGSNVNCSVGSDGSLTISATGKLESGAQKFGYVWRKLSGDFTLTVALDGATFERGGNQSGAGLMICADPSAEGTDMLYATSTVIDTDYYSHYRLRSGDKSSKKSMATRGSTDKVVLRLTRSGDSFAAAYSTDGGVTFSEGKSDSFVGLPEEVYVGLVVASGDNSKLTSATFSDFEVDGTPCGFVD